ncbi:hypothetical protein Nepgr_019045 [Nepenthes gracilis]|uniref:Fungal lipase-type domain-containing protein n=1 Tax=Nepenthes gracilis TaxID=150966 RepID=A0AAD3XUM1_NEPGR|nr:hypothetical protein Nepgr_019045 [Nepenthes gracilis]
MRLCIMKEPSKSYSVVPPTTKLAIHQCRSQNTQRVSFNSQPSPKNWESYRSMGRPSRLSPSSPIRLSSQWMEYQGVRNWDGLLDPLDENLRREILRYGYFVEAAYGSFEFDTAASTYGMCRFRKKNLLRETGFPDTGYRVTQNLRATTGIQLPRWTGRAPSWLGMQSSWIGYVAVCHDKEEIARLGRRDVVIALRGTATCLEWLENLRATLAPLSGHSASEEEDSRGPMVESGFLSLYTSSTATCSSLQEAVRREISRLLETYRDEELSFTLTGHSLGAALATLAAYDIKKTFERAKSVTVISFGGPRVGNRSFRSEIEKQGTKILRIVNPDDVITKVPGFLTERNIEDEEDEQQNAAGWQTWFQKRVKGALWAYAEVGCELRLMSPTGDDSPYRINNINVAECHDLKTYLRLVESFVGSNCPLRKTARRFLKRNQGDVAAGRGLASRQSGAPS